MNESNLLSEAIFQIISVAVIYLVIIVPTFLYYKKNKPNFWWIFLSAVIEIVIINSFFYGLLFYNPNIFLGFYFYGMFISLLFLLIYPPFIIKYISKESNLKKWEVIFLTYSIIGLMILINFFSIYYIVSLSMRSFHGYFN